MSVLIVFFLVWCWFMGQPSSMGLAVFIPTEPVTLLIETFVVVFIIYLIILNKHEKGDE